MTLMDDHSSIEITFQQLMFPADASISVKPGGKPVFL